jgi:hypothetical protein
MDITTLPVPVIRVHQLRALLDDPAAQLVWLVCVDDVDLAHGVLSAQHRRAEDEGRIKVLVSYDEAIDYLLVAAGDVAAAAGIANAVLERLSAAGRL